MLIVLFDYFAFWVAQNIALVALQQRTVTKAYTRNQLFWELGCLSLGSQTNITASKWLWMRDWYLVSSQQIFSHRLLHEALSVLQYPRFHIWKCLILVLNNWKNNLKIFLKLKNIFWKKEIMPPVKCKTISIQICIQENKNCWNSINTCYYLFIQWIWPMKNMKIICEFPLIDICICFWNVIVSLALWIIILLMVCWAGKQILIFNRCIMHTKQSHTCVLTFQRLKINVLL